MTLMEEATGTQSGGLLWKRQGVGHPYGWYPVMLSRDLGQGRVIGVDLCDGRLAIFRGEDGVVRATSAFCRHMGSDLSVGDVVGNGIRCAFHHWTYDGEGVCTKIPSGDRIPGAARLTPFRTEDKWGIVWVYWGLGNPIYPLPSIEDWSSGEWVYRAGKMPWPEDMPIEPFVFVANGFDFQHFRVVHGLDLDPEVEWNQYSGRWRQLMSHETVGEVYTDFNFWGTNSVIIQNVRGDEVLSNIAGGSPRGQQGPVFFYSVFTKKGTDAERILDEQEAFIVNVGLEDIPILSTLRFGDEHLVASDRNLVRFLRAYRDFPKCTMAEITAAGAR
jgi:phenylpropionate dioxygenase-like ring-hydroxylating dioxygenase large terminal subunit